LKKREKAKNKRKGPNKGERGSKKGKAPEKRAEMSALSALPAAHLLAAARLVAGSPYLASMSLAASATTAGVASVPISLAGAAAALAAPAFFAAAVKTAPDLKTAVEKTVHMALDSHKIVPPLYTEEDLDNQTPLQMCKELNTSEPEGLDPESDFVAAGRIINTLALVRKVGPFEKAACTLDELEKRVAALADLIPRIDFWNNTELVVNLAMACSEQSAAFAEMSEVRAALYSLVKKHTELVTKPPEGAQASSWLGWIWSSKPVTHPALALRQCEVAARALGIEYTEVGAFVAHVRARTWEDWLEGTLKLADLRFFGYEFFEVMLPVPIRVPVPDAKKSNTHWAAQLALSAAATLYPDVAAQIETITTIVNDTAPRLLYAGFERPGVALAMLSAAETREKLAPYDATYALAYTTVLRYMAALLEQLDQNDALGRVNDEIAAVVAKLKPAAEPTDPAAVAAPAQRKAPRVCAEALKNPELRKGKNFTTYCGAFFHQSNRRGHAADKLTNPKRGVNDLFAIFADIELLKETDQERYALLKARVEALASAAKGTKMNARTLRRLEVLCTRLGLPAQSANAALLAQITANAEANKPHGLAVDELGCEHTVVRVGAGSYMPSMYTPGPLPQWWVKRWGAWFAQRAAATLTPRLAAAGAAVSELQAQTTAAVQYKGLESPGTGYVLVKLLAILDDATAREYAEVKAMTLAAIAGVLPTAVDEEEELKEIVVA
jgi:hypothetical protein